MRDVAVVGVGMTKFGKCNDVGTKDLVRVSVQEALDDAGMKTSDLQAAYVGNAAAGFMTGQHMIRGQVTLAPMSIEDIPVYNVENACASSSTAFNLAWQAVAAGVHDCVLVAGFEKLYDQNKTKSFQALETGLDVDDHMLYINDVEDRLATGEKIFKAGGATRSRFLDVYAFFARRFMKRYGLTQEQIAMLSVKAHKNGSLNPKAQYQKEVTLDEVLNSGDISHPLTRMMCAPIGDGGAAAIICSPKVAARFTTKPVWVSSSIVASGRIKTDLDDPITSRVANQLYEASGIGPKDISFVELHDTTSSAEIMYLTELGLCAGEDAAGLIEDGYFAIDGKLPSNPSGGLTTKGHPVGATGVAQVYEVTKQLRGQAGARQVDNPKVGLTHNGGGILGIEPAAMALHLFRR